MATTIAIDPNTRDRLRTYGTAGDSYDDILRRMMDERDRDEFVAWCRRRMRETTEWVDLEDLEAELDEMDAREGL